jgi:hypothetical protein
MKKERFWGFFGWIVIIAIVGAAIWKGIFSYQAISAHIIAIIGAFIYVLGLIGLSIRTTIEDDSRCRGIGIIFSGFGVVLIGSFFEFLQYHYPNPLGQLVAGVLFVSFGATIIIKSN